ncbi:LytR/AlgR family response regulator transcription factor [Phosphitispora fastidiosa]|uniref:LytR/AlgR family response regulator transcription factor n=1 Tax=Phosphitispora fastidiosa TaxID=2837202 RepID=UPI001E592220|nr:response regulator [Phosphitispora fastidiosa]MBU7006028.1 two-component SAPR family response regulator [Phosphitispora fastidiosa]
MKPEAKKRNDMMYNAAVIDTDPATLEAMAGLLGNNPHVDRISCFSRMPDFFSELEKGWVQIAFIRVGGPGLQGLSLAKEIIKISPATRVVFMAGIAGYALMAFDEGARGYLLLPADQKRLDEVIENIRKRDNRKRGGSP